MAIDPDFVKNIAPELEDLTSTTIQFWIDQAELSVSVKVWGTKADLATGLLTAHYLTLSKRKGKGGVIKSQKVGDLKKEYDNGNLENFDDLDATSYGQQFKRLRKCLVITPRVISCPTQ